MNAGVDDIRPGRRIVIAQSDADLAGAEPPRVAQFYIVDIERHVADCVGAAVAIDLRRGAA